MVQRGWVRNRGIAATPGYFISSVPWAGTKTNTAFATRSQSSARLGGGSLDTNDTLVNNLFTEDRWADDGTYKLAVICAVGTDQGIHNFTGVSGTQTVDAYAAAAAENAYNEVTAIAVTKGLKTIQDQMATKNASSTAFGGKVNTWAYVRTGA